MANRKQQFHSIAQGQPGAGHLTAAWEHLVGHEYGAQEFASAYIDFIKQWDWDWVKINPRAVYYAEAWGGVYDQNDYGDFVIPKTVRAVINTPQDVSTIEQLDPAHNPALEEAAEAAHLIREALPDRGVIQTIFSPLSVLLQLADLPLYPNDTHAHSKTTVQAAIFDQPEVAKRALGNIARTLANYARTLVTPIEQGGAGLDGIFYAVTGTVSEGYFDRDRYREFSEPYDRIVIDAVREANPEAVVLLHTCRAALNPEWFDDLGVDVIQWDQYAAGNPKADLELRAVPVAGANSVEFEPRSSVSAVRAQIDETLALRGDAPFLLAPSCTVITPANDDALAVLAEYRAA